MRALCVICDRPVCGHDRAGRYLAEPSGYPKVTTTAGERVRTTALRILGDRYRVLLDNSKTYSFSPIERTNMDDIERVLDILSAMRSDDELVPDRAGGWAEAALA